MQKIKGFAAWNYENSVWKCGDLHNHQTSTLWPPSGLVLSKIDFFLSEGGKTCIALYDEVVETKNPISLLACVKGFSNADEAMKDSSFVNHPKVIGVSEMLESSKKGARNEKKLRFEFPLEFQCQEDFCNQCGVKGITFKCLETEEMVNNTPQTIEKRVIVLNFIEPLKRTDTKKSITTEIFESSEW